MFQFTFDDSIFTGAALPVDDAYAAITSTALFEGATETAEAAVQKMPEYGDAAD